MFTAAILSESQLALSSSNFQPPDIAASVMLSHKCFNKILPKPWFLCFFSIATRGILAILSFVKFAKQNPTGNFL